MLFDHFRCADFSHFFQLIAQHFVDVRHVIKVIAAIMVHPLHDLVGTKRLFAHCQKELAHLLTVQIQQVDFSIFIGNRDSGDFGGIH
ncbi:hypothetical protein D3C87_1994070 [compost metagenome]